MHEGHRNRLTSKVRENGIVYEHELMEILMFNACPRKDLNATAHALVERFGGVEGVLRAGCADLVEVDGVGVNMAEYIAVLGRSLHALREKDSFAVVSNVQRFREFISTRPEPKNDRLELYCLDKAGRVKRVCVFEAERGLRVSPGETEVLKTVSAYRPYGLFAASRQARGNHPPDNLDDAVSDMIFKISRLCGAVLYDYCLFGADGGFFSYKMSDRGMLAGNAGDGYGD